MAVEFDIKLTVKDMYRFKMYQIYAGVPAGFLWWRRRFCSGWRQTAMRR